MPEPATLSRDKEVVETFPTAEIEMGCDHCGQAVPEMLVCLGCHQAHYCTSACQHGAWFVRWRCDRRKGGATLACWLPTFFSNFQGWAIGRSARRCKKREQQPKLMLSVKFKRMLELRWLTPKLKAMVRSPRAATNVAWRRQVCFSAWVATTPTTAPRTASAQHG